MKVNIVGGGPGGLFLAILLKSRLSSSEVRVYEQNPEGATYGFGVGLVHSAIDKLAEADPVTMAALQDRMLFFHSQPIENPTGTFRLDFTTPVGTIQRLQILDVLLQRCDDLRVTVQHGVRIETMEELEDADLIVGADGANSRARANSVEDFGTSTHTRSNFFSWFGCEHPAHESGLRFREVSDNGQKGCVIAHYYAYAPGMWTFVPEIDQTSWNRLGMDNMDNAGRKAFIESCFEDVLDGQTLIENRSIWTQFTAVRNRHWHAGKRVLIGDALFRAHYSIGSGTRLAMEDALGLADALQRHPEDIEEALDSFERHGRSRKAALMAACEASYKWYEQAPAKLHLPILEFIADFMNRTGRMPADRLRSFAPGFADALLEQRTS